MAGYDGSIRINTLINDKGFINGFKRLGSSIRGLIGSLGFGLGIAGLVALGKQAIDTASDIQEVQNVVDTAFGSMSYKMEEFAKTSVKQFGLSQLAAKEIGSTFMAMASNMVGSSETASDMAINLTKRAADMASFYNRSAEDTATALHGVFTGETEVLKQYGIVQTEVNLQEYAAAHGINKKISAMTQAEKVQLRYNYVMEQTSLSAGDFARTSGSWANQTRILSEQFKELLSVLGSGLIAVFTPVIKFLNTVLSALIAIAKQIGAILSKLFGISIPTADSGKFASDLSAAAGGADDLANGMDAAGKSAEKAGKAASKALAPFDKLNVLNKDSGGGGGSGSGAGGGAGGGGFEMPELSFKEDTAGAAALGGALDGILDRLKQLKDLFVKGFFEGLGDYKPVLEELKKDILSIGKTLKEIFTDPEVVAAANRFADQLAYSLGQVVGSIARIGLTIAQNLIGGMEKYLTQNKERIKQFVIAMFDVGAEILEKIGELFAVLADILSVFGSDTAQQVTANIIGIFSETLMGALEFVAGITLEIIDRIVEIFTENKERIKESLSGTIDGLEKITKSIKETIEFITQTVLPDLLDGFSGLLDVLTPLGSFLLDVFFSVWNDMLNPILSYVGEKLIPALTEVFKNLWEKVLVPLGEFIGSVLSPVIGILSDILLSLWKNIIVPLAQFIGSALSEAFEGICEILNETVIPIVNAVIKVFQFLWENVFSPIVSFLRKTLKPVFDSVFEAIGEIINGLKKTFEGLIDFIVGTFTGDWEEALGGISKIFEGVGDAIKGVVNGILGTVESLANGVIKGINAVIKALNGLHFDIPDWIPSLGGKSFGFKISELSQISIPRLADGAVIRGGNPFMAVLGDQPRGQTNIETPLPTMLKAFKQAMAESGGMGGDISVRVYIGEKDVTQMVKTEADRYFKKTGRGLFAY